MEGPLRTVTKSIQPSSDECCISMITGPAELSSSGSIDKTNPHSFGFGLPESLSPTMETPQPCMTTWTEVDKIVSHSLKPLKKRHLAAYMEDAAPTKNNLPRKAATGAIGVPSVPNTGHISSAVPEDRGGYGINEGDALERRTDILTSVSSQKPSNPSVDLGASRIRQVVKADQSANICEGPHKESRSGESSGRSTAVGLSSILSIVSTPEPIASAPKRADFEEFKNGMCGDMNWESRYFMQPPKSLSPGPSQAENDVVQSTTGEKKRRGIRLKLKLRQGGKSLTTENCKVQQFPQGPRFQPAPQSKSTSMALNERATGRSTPTARHKTTARESGKITGVTPSAANKLPSACRTAWGLTPGQTVKNVRSDCGSESENKEPNAVVTNVRSAGMLTSMIMADKPFSAGFGKQKKAIGNRMMDTHRMCSPKTKRTGRGSGQGTLGQRATGGMDMQSSSCGGDGCAGEGLRIKMIGISSSSDNGNSSAYEDKLHLLRVDTDREDHFDVDFSVDDLTYYPEQPGSDDEDDGVDDIEGNVDKVNSVSERDAIVRRRRRIIKRKRLGKLFVSEEDEDEADPEFVPSKKLRYAVRKMRAEQELGQEEQATPPRKRRSGGLSRTGHAAMDSDKTEHYRP